ncbi:MULTISPECIES: ABC transporter permease [Kosakonia]|jgi:osmoprotectant transport system permease protein|uniref:ABC transporter permease n=2 Tax=Kosakonia TaxID=1330547 RepID=A0AA94KR91_9ENTR|nr:MULTISPECIES: ABC transporter permease [Kosakonia]SEK20317.1 osmoprotectant transport system permease protein [Kosakonia sacchari]ANI81221.1 ABC transporter permease [Kosakonia oryzae]APG19959.1 ABC transporter permease [Kosakonia radicincitans]ARD59021.1 ABC transporter permease [Kosakonia radicincitans DSM 16656]KDE33914.1 ABC transporter permease [Kosakonia radicincitans UMEnt01/12]
MSEWFLDLSHWYGDDGIVPLLLQHIGYSAAALAIAVAIAFPVGCYTGHTGKGEALLIGTTNALRSLPSFGLIILLVILLAGYFESDMAFVLPCIIVLVVLALPPVALGVHAGIRSVDPSVHDAAKGIGLTPLQVLLQVELPCAMPLILSGIRSAALQIVSTATIAAYVSLGGLGRLIIDGRAANDFAQMTAGAILVALLALIIDLFFSLSGKVVVSPGITRKTKNQ